MADMVLKGRGNSNPKAAEGAGNRSLTDEQVIEVRNRCSAGEDFEALAKEYDVALTTIGGAWRRDHYKHIEGGAQFHPRNGKMTKERREQMKERILMGIKTQSIVSEFGVSQGYICRLRRKMNNGG